MPLPGWSYSYNTPQLQLTYLLAFSCELAWLLSNNGDLHVASYLLCVLFFILFVAAFILIHGLVTVSEFRVYTHCAPVIVSHLTLESNMKWLIVAFLDDRTHSLSHNVAFKSNVICNSLTTLLQKTLMELASWAILIGILAIPELIFVVHMISEHWVSCALTLFSVFPQANKELS